MSNSYKYIDPDFKYTEPKTGLLRNLQDITDPNVLLFVESGAATKRLQELYQNPIKVKSIDSIFEIHRHLFQDIYIWAGKKRVQCLNEALCFVSSSVLADILVLRNRQFLVAATS